MPPAGCWPSALSTLVLAMRRTYSIAFGFVVAARFLSAQAVPRDQYYQFLPPMSKLVTQTQASERLKLYGDRSSPQYSDVQPVDGIDDTRAAHLLALADRFSPILRRNNFSGPRDFNSLFGEQGWIRIDHWKDEQLVHSDSVALGCPAAASVRTLASGDDRKLVDLLQRFSPMAGDARFEPAEGRSEITLYIDYPGEDEGSWRNAYRSTRGVRSYVHPFVQEDTAAGADRYALVLQYWFFYPFNDGTNNHEGDWEHLNVVVTTSQRERAPNPSAARVNESEMQRILSGALPLDSLSIALVEYYFHETYVVLDYLSARRAPVHRTGRFAEFLHFHVWEEPEFINRTIQQRLNDSRLATHPIGYIGGNNRGPDEFTHLFPRFQAAYNRNAHGTYPFPGVWQAVGPLGSTEQLAGAAVPAWSSGAERAATLKDEHFTVFQRLDLVLVPDWERVWPAMTEDAALRSAWAWLVLPVRWGYPASQSPGAGALKHVDLGNIAPEGPAFQPTWNRLATTTGWRAYYPNVLRVLLVPATPWARVRNGWGILNLPVGLLGFLPGWNVFTSQAMPWLTGTLHMLGVEPPKTYYPGEPPFRFTSSGVGVVRTTGGATFARLLTDAAQSERAAIPPSGVSQAEISTGQRIWFNIFYGRRLSVENTYGWSDAILTFQPPASSPSATPGLTGTIDLKELTSGFRVNTFGTNDDVVQFYGRGGWGYNWYELREFAVNGIARSNVSSQRRLPTHVVSLEKVVAEHLVCRRWIGGVFTEALLGTEARRSGCARRSLTILAPRRASPAHDRPPGLGAARRVLRRLCGRMVIASRADYFRKNR